MLHTKNKNERACANMRKWYVKSFRCMVKHIYIVIQSERSYNSLKVKIVQRFKGVGIFTFLGRTS